MSVRTPERIAGRNRGVAYGVHKVIGKLGGGILRGCRCLDKAEIGVRSTTWSPEQTQNSGQTGQATKDISDDRGVPGWLGAPALREVNGDIELFEFRAFVIGEIGLRQKLVVPPVGR